MTSSGRTTRVRWHPFVNRHSSFVNPDASLDQDQAGAWRDIHGRGRGDRAEPYYVATLARVSLEASKARADLLRHAIYQRAHAIVSQQTADPYTALKSDGGLRTILDSAVYSNDVTDAAVVKPDGSIVASLDPTRVERRLRRTPIDNVLALNKAQLVWALIVDPGGARIELSIDARQRRHLRHHSNRHFDAARARLPAQAAR